MKPHLRQYAGMWRCSAPPERGRFGYPYCPFPWGYGKTPQDAQRAWCRMTKTPLHPRLAPPSAVGEDLSDSVWDRPHDLPLPSTTQPPTMNDEHADNPGAA